MSSNGRPKLGYSNIFWSNIDREQRAKIFNREELIQEVLSGPLELPVDRMQLMTLSNISKKGLNDDKESSNQRVEANQNNQHSNVENDRHAV